MKTNLPISVKSVLVGEISSYKAIVICNFISKNYPNIQIFGYDSRITVRYIATKYSTKNFHVDTDNFVADIEQIIINNDIDLLIPVIGDQYPKLLKAKDKLNGTLNYLGDLRAFEALNNKDELLELAWKLNLGAPKTFRTLKEAKIPYVIKPNNLSSSKGVKYIFNSTDVPDFLPDDYVIQQYIEGRGVGYSVYSLNGVIQEGYGHMRILEYPLSGGSSTYRKGFETTEMISISSAILQHLSYTGFVMFEFKLDIEGNIFLIEANPRIWGSINQGLVNGTNYFRAILGEPATRLQYDSQESRTVLFPLVVFSIKNIVKNIVKNDTKKIVERLSRLRLDVHPLRDFGGFLSVLMRFLR